MSPTRRSGHAGGEPARLSEADPPIALTWLGWSGFRITGAGGTQLFIDPPKAADIPQDRDVQILLTHGHPEHVAGTIRYLARDSRRARATVLASPRLSRVLARRPKAPGDRLLGCRPGQTLAIGGVGVDVFEWRHMTLLPSGLRPALVRLCQLARRPGLALRIAARAARIPRPGPMLGFRLTLGHGRRLMFFGEGLHRKTDAEAVTRVVRRLPAEIGIIAVEPEDMDVLAALIARLRLRAAVLYEAHGPWRDAFHMPRADLDALRLALGGAGMTGIKAVPGERRDLPALMPTASASGITG